jgi:PBP4 family serine-type D-alanyl-D-alanine carboxypeptidase
MFHFKQDSTLKLQSKGADNTIAYNSAVPNRDYWRISKTDANEYARLMVKRQLEKEGIVFVEKKIKSSEKKLLLEIKALETIEEYIRPVNTYSDNFRAELLALQLNRCLSGKATYADLSENLSKYQPKILPAGIQIFDGSGLSRKNRLSAKILVRLLDTMSHSDVHHHFERSLAVAGKTGTLKNRFKGSAFEGRFLGKTGTLDKVTALSGYWFKDDATSVKLSFIGNGADNKLYWQALESFAKSL